MRLASSGPRGLGRRLRGVRHVLRTITGACMLFSPARRKTSEKFSRKTPYEYWYQVHVHALFHSHRCLCRNCGEALLRARIGRHCLQTRTRSGIPNLSMGMFWLLHSAQHTRLIEPIHSASNDRREAKRFGRDGREQRKKRLAPLSRDNQMRHTPQEKSQHRLTRNVGNDARRI
jgi:hypothetical protein